MKIRGWVYVITNEAMPGLVKIGYSTKDPTLRAQELAGTGNPVDFTVAYDALVFNPSKIEHACHKSLNSCRKGKEWFQCTVEKAKTIIQQESGEDLLLENNIHAPAITPMPRDRNTYSCKSCGKTCGMPDSIMFRCDYCGKTALILN